MDKIALETVARDLVAPGKGILAADESTKTIEKRFTAVGLRSTAELNRKYREMLFTTPGIEEYISGIIMFDETVRQNIPINKSVIPGIKVDEGLEPFGENREEITKGLAGLEVRLKEYLNFDLKFSKWRGVFKISATTPSEGFLIENLERVAKFAEISQRLGLVPIVEPEILLDGDHTTSKCEETETKVLKKLFEKLAILGVYLPGLLLKTSMVLPGKDSGVKAEPLEVAQATLRTLKNSVPPDVPGIVFLAGGQSEEEATANLREINKIGVGSPWQLSFSFGRALQNSALEIWAGKDENVKKAQEAFYIRAKLNSEARYGR